MSDIFTADVTDEVCSECGRPVDDHLVRELKQCALRRTRKPFTPYRDPMAVLVAGQQNLVHGVQVFATAVEIHGTMIPQLIFRFLLDDESWLPDLAYRVQAPEARNFANIVQGAVTKSIKAARVYRAPKERP